MDEPETGQVPQRGSADEPVAERYKLARVFEPASGNQIASSAIGQGLAQHVTKLGRGSLLAPLLLDSISRLNTAALMPGLASISRLNTAALAPGLASIAKVNTNALAPGLASIAKVNTNAFAPGLAPIAKVNTAVFAPGLFESVSKLSTMELASGLFDSVSKLDSFVLMPGLADSIAKLSSAALAPAFAELLAESLQAGGTVSDSKAGRLSREDQRLLCGYLAYIITWLLLLKFVLTIVDVGGTVAKLADLVVMMTGISGHRIASLAKETTCKAYDKFNPPSQ